VNGTLYRTSLHVYANAKEPGRWPTSRAMSKTEAGRWATSWRAEVQAAPPKATSAPPTVLTFADAAARYEAEHVRVPGRRPRAVAEMVAAVKRLVALPLHRGGHTVLMGSLPLAAIVTADVEDWRAQHRADLVSAQKARATATTLRAEGKVPAPEVVQAAARAARAVQHGAIGRNRLVGRLRNIFNWAIRRGLTDHTPFRRHGVTVIQLEPEASRSRRLARGDEDRLLAVAGQHLGAMIVAALDSGLRLGELLALQWRDLDLVRGVITLPASKAKTNRARPALVSKRLSALLEMRRDGPDGQRHPLDAYVFGDAIGRRLTTIKTAWTTATRKADLPGLHFHDLRHEFGSRALDAGAHLADVRDALGHSSLTMTSRYLNTSPERLRRMMDLMEQDRTAAACKPLANSTDTPATPPTVGAANLLN
jgi:integrase